MVSSIRETLRLRSSRDISIESTLLVLSDRAERFLVKISRV